MRFLVGWAVFVLLARPARAECFDCFDGVGTAVLLAMIGYGCLALAILFTAFDARTRPTARRLLRFGGWVTAGLVALVVLAVVWAEYFWWVF
jgi:hypothetical protein